MNSTRPPFKHFAILLTATGWGIASLLYQVFFNFFPYPKDYGLNIHSVIWAAWSLPTVIGIIFGPFFLSMLVLHHWKSPFFEKESETKHD